MSWCRNVFAWFGVCFVLCAIPWGATFKPLGVTFQVVGLTVQIDCTDSWYSRDNIYWLYHMA